MMEFSVGERVKITALNIIGTVLQTEYKITRVGTMVDETKKYYVQRDGYYYPRWYHEYELEVTYELSEGMLEQINKLLIDIHLKEGNFNIVKQLASELYDGRCE